MDDAKLLAALQREHLMYFLVQVFRTLNPGAKELHLGWYLRAMCFKLQQAGTNPRSRLVISVPPRHLKSISATVALVAWLLGRDPKMKIMVATYSAELAREHSEACRTVMNSLEYKRLFPGTRIDPKKNRQLDFKTTMGGGRRAVSVTGSTTGLGADLIILDDCMKADDIASEVERERVKNWYGSTMVTRLNSKAAGSILSVQQRLGEDDLTQKLLDNDFEHLCLRAIAECNECFEIGFGKIYHRKVGELLDPGHEDQEAVDDMRRASGPAVFAAQYQQNPVAPEGNLIRIEKFARYDGPMEREEFHKVIQSWDTGMSDLPTSDYSVCTTWGFLADRWYLLDVLRRQLAYPDLRDAVLHLQNVWRADRVVIEDAGSGISLWQELHKFKGALRPIMWRPAGSKQERLIGQLGQIEDGRVLLPNNAPWLDVFLNELRAFPFGKHDDQVDSMTQFLEFAMSRKALIHIDYNPKTGRRCNVIRKASVTRR